MKSNREILTKIEFMIIHRESALKTIEKGLIYSEIYIENEQYKQLKKELELLKELKKWCME